MHVHTPDNAGLAKTTEPPAAPAALAAKLRPCQLPCYQWPPTHGGGKTSPLLSCSLANALAMPRHSLCMCT